jgi:hypothetical protein
VTVVRDVPDPDAAPHGPRTGLARSLIVASALACGILVGSLGAAAASARPAQDPGVTTTSLPGATTSTTAATSPSTTTTTAASDTTDADADNVADEDRKIWLVVAGLVTVALALTALTIRYWLRTKPVPLPVPDEVAADEVSAAEPEPDDLEPADDIPAGSHGRHSRRAVAGADHATVDDEWEPRGTGEHDRIEVPARSRTTRPTRDQRRAAFESAKRSG